MTQSFPVCGKNVICLPIRMLIKKKHEYVVGIYTRSQSQDSVIIDQWRLDKVIQEYFCITQCKSLTPREGQF